MPDYGNVHVFPRQTTSTKADVLYRYYGDTRPRLDPASAIRYYRQKPLHAPPPSIAGLFSHCRCPPLHSSRMWRRHTAALWPFGACCLCVWVFVFLCVCVCVFCSRCVSFVLPSLWLLCVPLFGCVLRFRFCCVFLCGFLCFYGFPFAVLKKMPVAVQKYCNNWLVQW